MLYISIKYIIIKGWLHSGLEAYRRWSGRTIYIVSKTSVSRKSLGYKIVHTEGYLTNTQLSLTYLSIILYLLSKYIYKAPLLFNTKVKKSPDMYTKYYLRWNYVQKLNVQFGLICAMAFQPFPGYLTFQYLDMVTKSQYFLGILSLERK